jgi:putative flavoprotein involved in K+ transport
MLKTTTLVVGAGHSGLAMSRCLTDHSIDHVVLERGEVADSWRTQRWDSMRLLTPNWMTRLPGFAYGGDDPDGYLSASEVVQLIEHYGKETGAPVVANTTVTSARRTDDGYVVRTDQDSWHARSIVVASGANTVAKIPALQAGVPPGITTLTPADYRNPRELPDGGIQIAAELHRAGRRVTLAVGEHVRMPRMYRGRDILWWMDATGLFDERYDQVPDLVRVRALPSMQLVGSSDRASIDLNSLSAQGVQLVGRLAGIRDGIAQFSGSLPNMFTLADLKLGRLLDTIDTWAVETGWDGGDPPRRFEPTAVHGTVPLTMDLRSGDVRTILWATGFRPDVPWLDVPVFDTRGQIRHDGGVTPSPGLYLMGMPFMRRRKSSFIDGAAADAADLSGHLAHYLDSN